MAKEEKRILISILLSFRTSDETFKINFYKNTRKKHHWFEARDCFGDEYMSLIYKHKLICSKGECWTPHQILLVEEVFKIGG